MTILDKENNKHFLHADAFQQLDQEGLGIQPQIPYIEPFYIFEMSNNT